MHIANDIKPMFCFVYSDDTRYKTHAFFYIPTANVIKPMFVFYIPKANVIQPTLCSYSYDNATKPMFFFIIPMANGIKPLFVLIIPIGKVIKPLFLFLYDSDGKRYKTNAFLISRSQTT